MNASDSPVGVHNVVGAVVYTSTPILFCDGDVSLVVTSLWDEHSVTVHEELFASIVSGAPWVRSVCPLVDGLVWPNRVIVAKHTRIVVPPQSDDRI